MNFHCCAFLHLSEIQIEQIQLIVWKRFKLIRFLVVLCSYDSTTGVFTVPSGGDGVYYFSTYVLVDQGEAGRFDMRLNDDVICTTDPDHNNNGAGDFAPGSCSAVVDVVAGKQFPILE